MCWHEWGDWSLLKSDANNDTYQIRFCSKCNKAEVRWVT